VACEFSGRVRDAFAAKGHDAWSCDILPSERSGNHLRGDVRKHLQGWDLIIGHPPCTYLTVSGNRWLKPELKHRYPKRGEWRELAVQFFMALADAPSERICYGPYDGLTTARKYYPLT